MGGAGCFPIPFENVEIKKLVYALSFLHHPYRILMFEEKKKEKAKPKGVAPKRDLSSLP